MTGVKTPERLRQHIIDTLKIKLQWGLSAPGATRRPRGYLRQDENLTETG